MSTSRRGAFTSTRASYLIFCASTTRQPGAASRRSIRNSVARRSARPLRCSRRARTTRANFCSYACARCGSSLLDRLPRQQPAADETQNDKPHISRNALPAPGGPGFQRRRLFANSQTTGATEITMIPRITFSKCALTMGTFPNPYPSIVIRKTHPMPPKILNDRNRR